jgi:chitosanase
VAYIPYRTLKMLHINVFIMALASLPHVMGKHLSTRILTASNDITSSTRADPIACANTIKPEVWATPTFHASSTKSTTRSTRKSTSTVTTRNISTRTTTRKTSTKTTSKSTTKSTTKTPVPTSGPDTAALNACQKSIIFQATNIYENSKVSFSYDYCENLGDGRGYTSGIIGFTTGTHDAYAVIRQYVATPGHGNEFEPYMEALKRIDQVSGLNPDVKGLSGYCAAWAKASAGQVFRSVQRSALESMYYNPSQKLADTVGLKLPLGRGQFYDAGVQHGIWPGADDTLNDMIDRTTKKVGGTPKTGKSELTWVRAFLDMRATVLCNPKNRATQKVWCVSKSRVASYVYALDQSNGSFDTSLPMLDNSGRKVTINCNLSL